MTLDFKWTNTLGLARTLLALGTVFTLLVNSNAVLFNTLALNEKPSLLQGFGLFYLLKDYLVLAKTIAIFALLLVLSGYYPRYTGIIHWYISYSFFSSCNLIDGGDHITAVITFLLLPITITDSRKSHWDPPVYSKNTIRSILARSFLTLVKIQVCAIYFHSFVGKAAATEWVNGTATFYWLTHEYFGIHATLRPLFLWLLSNAFAVTIVTWGTLAVEFLLSAGIVLDKNSPKRKWFLITGILFHFSIVIVHGLASFFFAVSAGLILYLLPNDYVINITSLLKKRKLKFYVRSHSRF
ncbi:sporulation-delaying protein SdpB family protein [Ascidiimonas aurantiaca]|uniref:sporulation-delaying protein SdpB family protein n=1 Tax=Ascidiimonas aurantiaca TaxID=1685432 RepID=UPI0030EEFD15